ncbi:MAG: deoxyribonuclease IV [Thermoproteota archaeon]|jgi:deoxyribonuclease-4|nr:deoxyribonuclease IV [Thermoproteota archaeon]
MDVRVGVHVSIAGGISNSISNAKKKGCTAFQIFSRNPRGWTAKDLQHTEVQLFRNRLIASGIGRCSIAVHMPYLPNLSGPDGEFYKKSVQTLTEEMNRCRDLEIPHLVIHLGSHMGRGSKSGIDQLVKAISRASRGKCEAGPQVLLENNTGHKNNVGASFEELRIILDRLGNSKQFGVCIDTCHLFASGYDLRTMADVEQTLKRLNDIVGLKELKLVHLNDSKAGIGSNIDRHEHIGLGLIGLEGMAAFLNFPQIRVLPIILETPIDKKRGDEENLKVVRDMVG